jgi:hypothetical protein
MTFFSEEKIVQDEKLGDKVIDERIKWILQKEML